MKLRVAELFAGIGAWSKALERLGVDHEVVEAIELDKKTISSYNLIHNSEFKNKDITMINPKEFPEHDLLFYSPPCQAFSIAGKQEGFGDARGTLFFEALKIIQKKKPKYAIMENVKGLTQKKFINEFETMLRLLEQEGYKNYWKVLNAKNYGIPQSRERVFIVSVRKDLDLSFEFPKAYDNGLRLKDLLEEEVDEKFYINEEKTRKLLDEFKGKYGFEDSRNVCINTKMKNNSMKKGYAATIISSCYKEPLNTLEVYPCITPERINKRQNGRRFKEDGDPSFTINTQDKHGILQIGLLEMKGNEQIRRVYDPSGISLTLNTMQGGNRRPKIIQVGMIGDTGYEKERRVYSADGISPTLESRDSKGAKKIMHEYRIRKLTPLECFRLMGFDDEDYDTLKNNKVSNSQIYKMAGNSIVVNVIEEILKELIPQYIASKSNTYEAI
ncbi:DNA cytosine methyltransferase [Paenibacillus polymyxa]|uniref:DNA cytosine methyltransferase n=1 Tax=Paenibacillus polymyxa TaxID=1406 RepID=UPI002AB3C6CC|nr:DNA cytosine methyltransferase [Paenibacillus polymyxa]MDY8021120.1 DNA cytosine methyltransferase [Paenibacillus polymyxa]